MLSTMRTVIDVPDEIIESLDRVGGSEQRSRAALIREAIADFVQRKSNPTAEAAFGIWKQKGIDGLRYQEELRIEWACR